MTPIQEMLALGLREHQAGHLDQAHQLYCQILQANPAHPDALHLMGVLISQKGRDDLAVPYIERALIIRPDVAAFHNNLGFSYQALNRLEEAESAFREAIRLQPHFAMAHNNLGNVYRCRGQTEEAGRCYRHAIELQPDYSEAHGNLGVVLQEQGKFAEALPCYERALELNPNHAETHMNRAMLWLALGKWGQGWSEFEWRWRTKEMPGYPLTQPRWDGSALNGKRIFLYGEQGLGDTLQFLRYLPLVKQRGGRIIMECQSQLVRLLTGYPGIDHLQGRGNTMPDCDVHMPLMSLPGIFHTEVNSIPNDVPYIEADGALTRQWQRELRKSPKRFRVGLTWQGNPSKPFDAHRSIALESFVPLAKVPGVQLISVQKGPAVNQIQALADCLRMVDLGTRLDEAAGAFMDTAALMKSLDLVISSDTAVPHLAGALGVPVWVALPLASDWRWLVEREDSPWYPTMRLFRQTRYGQWQDVFERIAAELERATR